MSAAAPASAAEILIATIAGLLADPAQVRHVAVGASSPIPGAAALLARARREVAGLAPLRLSILGSQAHNSFTSGGVEIFDMAATGRIDVFFLGGGEIDGAANINLIGVGTEASGYPEHAVRWPGSFGSAYLYHLVPRVILFREEHTRRVFVPKVDFISAAGPRDDGVYRPGGPHAMLTGLCLFDFDKARRRFVLLSVHPGHTVEEVRDQTGFDFDVPQRVPQTPAPDDGTLSLMRSRILDQIGETYPNFSQLWRSSLNQPATA